MYACDFTLHYYIIFRIIYIVFYFIQFQLFLFYSGTFHCVNFSLFTSACIQQSRSVHTWNWSFVDSALCFFEIILL